MDNENTARAYAHDLKRFTSWCQERGIDSRLPVAPESVADHLRDLSRTLSYQSVNRARAAIAWAHRQHGHDDVADHHLVRHAMADIRKRSKESKASKPLTRQQLQRVVKAQTADTPNGDRDRALLLVAWHSDLRRSEIAALNVDDVDSLPPEAREAVSAWLEWLPGSGPLFRPVTRHGRIYHRRISDRAVNEAIRRCITRAGMRGEDYCSESLRAGLHKARQRDIERAIEGLESQSAIKAVSKDGEWARRAYEATFLVESHSHNPKALAAARELRDALTAPR